MLKNLLLFLLCSACFPALVSAAPASVYGKALQRAKQVSAQASQSRQQLPPQPDPAAKVRRNIAAEAKTLIKKLRDAKLDTYPVSGAAGVNELLAKKIIKPASFGLPPGTVRVTERELAYAWFGSEANKAGNGVFPLIVSKPSAGPVSVCFTDGSVIEIKSRPRTVTGVISVLRSRAKDKKSPLWEHYFKTARAIDKASK